MSNSYTVLWTRQHCDAIREHRHEGRPLVLLFGGPHSSEPRYSSYGVRPGDWVYPVFVRGGVLHIVGRVRAARLISEEEFTRMNPGGMASWWEESLPDAQYLAPTCTDEVLIGGDGTPIRLDLAVPADVLERLRFRSKRGERPLKHVENGRLTNVSGLQGGVCRLTRDSACDFEELLLASPPPAASETPL